MRHVFPKRIALGLSLLLVGGLCAANPAAQPPGKGKGKGKGPPDAELLHQIPLGRQPVARQIAPFVDHRLETAGHFLVELAAPNGARGVWYTYHTSRILGFRGKAVKTIAGEP